MPREISAGRQSSSYSRPRMLQSSSTVLLCRSRNDFSLLFYKFLFQLWIEWRSRRGRFAESLFHADIGVKKTALFPKFINSLFRLVRIVRLEKLRRNVVCRRRLVAAFIYFSGHFRHREIISNSSRGIY